MATAFPRGASGSLWTGVRDQAPGLAVHRQVGAADQPVAVQDREHEVPPLALELRRVDLQPVREAEQLLGAAAVAQQVVERRQERGAGLERRRPVSASTSSARTHHSPFRPSTSTGTISPLAFERRQDLRQPGVAAAREVRADVRRARDAERLRASSAARRVTSASSSTSVGASGGRQRSIRSYSRWPPPRAAIPTCAAHPHEVEHPRRRCARRSSRSTATARPSGPRTRATRQRAVGA